MKDFINSCNNKICSTPTQSSTISWTTPVNITKAGFAHPYEILVPDQLYRIRGLETIGTNSIHPVCGHCCGSDTLTIYGNTDICGNAHVSGKLTVDGLIDPTGLVLDEQASAPFTAASTSKGLIWIKSEDRGLYYNDSAGNSIRLGGIEPGSTSNAVLLIGDQTVLGLKTFSNGIIGNLTGNASTVTKGAQRDASINLLESSSNSNSVLLTGDQTVLGSKTFTNVIIGNLTGNATTVTKGAQRDASINLLDTSVDFLEASSAKYDVSLNALDISKQNTITAGTGLEFSGDTLNAEVTQVELDLKAKKTYVDSSLNLVNIRVDTLDASAVIYEASLNAIDTSKQDTITAGDGLSFTGATLNAEVTQAELNAKQNTITAGTGLEFSEDTLNAEVTQAELDLKADKTYVDGSLNLVNTRVDTLDASATIYEASLNAIDTSKQDTIIAGTGLEFSGDTLNAEVTQAELDLKADKTFVDDSHTWINAAINLKADKTYVDGSFNLVNTRVDTLDASATIYETNLSTIDTSLTQHDSRLDTLESGGGGGSASSGVQVHLNAIQTITEGNAAIVYSTTPDINIFPSIFTINEDYIKVNADMKAYISYEIAIDKGRDNDNYILYELEKAPAGTLDWVPIPNSIRQVGFPSQTPVYVSSHGSCIVNITSGERIRCVIKKVGTSDHTISLINSDNGSTTLSIHDLFGGEPGPAADTSVLDTSMNLLEVSSAKHDVSLNALDTSKQDTITAGDGLLFTGATLNAEVTQAELNAKQNTITAGTGLEFSEDTLNAEVTQAELDLKADKTYVDGSFNLVNTRVDTLDASVNKIELKIIDVSNNLDTEITSRKAAEWALYGLITTNGTNITDNVSNITDEITRAKAAESTNASTITDVSNNLDTEVTRAKTAESTNASTITDVSNNLDTEVTRAKAAENLKADKTYVDGNLNLVNTRVDKLDASAVIYEASLNALDISKQDTITAGTGLSFTGATLNAEVTQAELDLKADKTYVDTNLNLKQDTIGNGDLTIAQTNGLQAALDSATNDRAAIRTEFASADTTLQNAINTVQADVDQNETDADAAIAALQADVNKNETDADAAIAALQADVDKNETDADAALDSATNDRAAIRTEFASADTTLQNAINTVQADVDQNETDADAAIAALQADVDKNETDADAAIAALQVDVDKNETDADAAIAALQTTVSEKQDTITAGDGLSLTGATLNAEVTQEELDAKQNTITAGDGLSLTGATLNAEVTQAELDLKADKTYVDTNLNLKQDTIGNGDLTIAQTNGLQAALDSATGGTPGKWEETGSDIYYNSGKVGIGNNSPEEKLDVSGNIAVSGKVDGVDVSTLPNAINTVQADVDQNETDADAAFVSATNDRAAIRTEFASADTTLQNAINTVQADVDKNETDADAAITAEATTARTAEGENATAISGNTTNLSALTTTVTTLLGGVGAEELNTLKKLSDALNDDDDFATTVTNHLSTNTTAIEANATAASTNASAINTVQADVDKNETDADAAIAAVQVDVDKNETDADAAFVSATNDRAAIRTEFASADTTLQNAINAVQADVNQNETDADAAIAAVQVDVDKNETDADAAIAALQVDVDKNETDADAAFVSATNDRAAIRTEFASADTTLQTAINAVQADVNQNETDADAAIAALQADVNQNETDADAAIAALQADVNQNETDADAAFVSATNDRAAIRTEFASADTTLQTAIDTVKAVVDKNETDADAAFVSATNDRAAIRTEFASADTTLQNAIDTVQADVNQNETDADAAIAALQTTVSEKQDTITAGDGLSLTGATLNAEVTQTELDAKQNTITAGDGLSLTGATLNAEVTQAELDLKAPLESPYFTSNITLDGTNDTDGALLHIKSKGNVVLKLEADSNNLGETNNPVIHFTQDGSLVEGSIGMTAYAVTDIQQGNALTIGACYNGIQFQISSDGGGTTNLVNMVNAMRITPGGDVGIGAMEAPTDHGHGALGYKLLVGGDIKATSDIIDGSNNKLSLKANIANPTFTGTPAAPTANAGTNTTQLATTAFVTTAVGGGGGGGGKWEETGSDIYYNSGKVGIGKNNPSQKLDIVGNIAVSGTVDGVDISTLSTTVDALKWNVNNHTDLHSKTGGPAPKTQIVAGVTDISGSGFIRIYTASGEILCGQPVCEDISNDGPIKATTPSETTPSWKILGIALSTVANGAAVSILANGYTTARRTTKYLGMVRNETIMDPIKMGVDDGTYGMADTLYGDSRTVNLNGTINFKDSGGDSNYSANERYPWLTFTVAAGKKMLVKINSFYFEFGSSVAYDHLGVEYSTDGTSWEKLNDTIAPTWSNWLYYASESAWKTGNNSWVKKFFGGYNSNITGNGGGWMFGENSADISPDDVGNYYPSNTLDTWHVVNAQYIRFHFRSDSSTERSGWNIDIASAETSTDPAPTIIGEPLYIDTTDYTKLSDTSNNNTSGHHIGYVAATDASNDSVYIRVADFSIFDGAIGPQGVQGEKGNTGVTITAGTGLSLTGTTLNAEVTQAELDLKADQISVNKLDASAVIYEASLNLLDIPSLWTRLDSFLVPSHFVTKLRLHSGAIHMPLAGYNHDITGNILHTSVEIGVGICAADYLQSNYEWRHSSVFVGNNIGQEWQTDQGLNIQGMNYCVCIGDSAGRYNMEYQGIAIGARAGNGNKTNGQGLGKGAVAIGYQAAYYGTEDGAIVIGHQACGQTCAAGAGSKSVTIGTEAGANGMYRYNVSIGYRAAWYGESRYGNISIGYNANALAGAGNDAHYGNVAIGMGSAYAGMDGRAVCLGSYCGQQGVGFGSIVIGDNVGSGGKIGQKNIWIGYRAVQDANVVSTNTIVLNATGTSINPAGNNRCYITPIRNDTSSSSSALQYNSTTGEIFYNNTEDTIKQLIARIVALEAVPYEPWNLDITLSEFILQDTWIYYVQFTAPASTKYNEMNLFTTWPSSNSKWSGSIGVGIYADIPGQPGGPGVLIGGGTSSFTLQNMRRRHITISFVTSASVIKNTRYWVAISADNTSGSIFMGFHNDYGDTHNVVQYQNKNGYTIGGGMPSSANVTTVSSPYAYWFRLSSAVSGGGEGEADEPMGEPMDEPR